MTTNTTGEDRTPAQTLATAMRTAVAAQRDLAVLKGTTAYIAGPMSGIEAFNFPAFQEAARELGYMGFGLVYHTATGTPPAPADAAPWPVYLRVALRKLLGCDAVVALPGWRESKGARLEVHVALELGMPVVEYPNLRPVESLGINIPAPPDIPEGEAPTWDEIKPYLYPATQGGLAVIPEGAKYGTQTAEYIARRYGGVDGWDGRPIVVPSDDVTDAEYGTQTAEYIARRYGGNDPRTVTIAGVEFDTTEDPEP